MFLFFFLVPVGIFSYGIVQDDSSRSSKFWTLSRKSFERRQFRSDAGIPQQLAVPGMGPDDVRQRRRPPPISPTHTTCRFPSNTRQYG